MPLDASYTQYPHRRRGYDHDMYAWSALKDRPPILWPQQKKVATWIVVSLEYFPILPSDVPFRAPGHMQTVYPDYRHYTAREYGTRVGFYRLLDAFAAVDAKVSVAANAAIAQLYPSIIQDIVDAGHEIIAHSTDMNGTIATGMSPDDERSLIRRSLAALAQISGERPRGWLSIARSQSWDTHQYLVDEGVEYCCDWTNDEMPWVFANGLVNIPLNHELSDRQVINVQQQSMDSYAEQIRDAFDWLSREADEQCGGRMLPVHVTPYITGLPHRMDAFEQLLGDVSRRSDNWFARGSDILDSL
jgi:peptidoglycan/xylan/chitin deacetylase (PgdA/CDA1 family)